MAEKFFIVTEESPHRQEYFDYRQNRKEVKAFVSEFLKAHGIETTRYCPMDKKFFIIPTEKDRQSFKLQLCALSDNYGLVQFKMNSAIGKAWIQELTETGLKILREPFVPFFFQNICGKSSYRIFSIDNTVYVYFSTSDKINTPVGFREIKGSEYHKVIEDWEEKNK